MKKIYLLALALSSVAVSQAQRVADSPARRNFTKGEISTMTAVRQDLNNPVLPFRVELLNENFDDVMGTPPVDLPSDWTSSDVIDADGNTIPGFKIHTSSTANNGGYWPVPLTETNNRFAGANDDGPPCDCDMIEVNIDSPELDFSTATNVAVTFDIFHDQGFGGGDATLQVSTDGGQNFNIIQLGVDGDGNPIEVLPVDVDYWQTIIVPVYDLSGEASVIFRWQWTDAGSWASGFALDNVIVGELPNYDLKADKVKFGDWNQETFEAGVWDYTQVPVTQVSPIKATVVVSNNGFNDQADVTASFEVLFDGNPVSGSPFAASETNPELLSLAKDTLSVVTNYTPSGVGTVTVTATTSSASGDDVAGNNSTSNTMEITDYIYARDANGAQAFVNPETDYEYGNLFDIYAEDQFAGVLFAVGAGSDEGATIQGRVYEWTGLDNDGLPVLDDTGIETVEYDVMESDFNAVGEANFIFLPFDGGAATLEAGKTYLVTILSAGDMRVPVSGSNEWVVSWLFDGEWGATLSIPMVRITSEESLNVEGLSATAEEPLTVGQAMPNPAIDYTLLTYAIQSPERVEITIRDMQGRVVANQEEGLKMAGSHSARLNVEALSAGVYMYTISAGDFHVTRELMVR